MRTAEDLVAKKVDTVKSLDGLSESTIWGRFFHSGYLLIGPRVVAQYVFFFFLKSIINFPSGVVVPNSADIYGILLNHRPNICWSGQGLLHYPPGNDHITYPIVPSAHHCRWFPPNFPWKGGICEISFRSLEGTSKDEQWKTPGLFRVYRGWNTTQIYRDYNKP